jgi:orotidine-5'-phosphate decarboxylase
MPGVFCAIDTADLAEALKLVKRLSGLPLHYKLGLKFFSAQGLAGVEKIRAVAGRKAEIFLDLKFHDIPNTVSGAVRSALRAEPQFLTVHASGGKAMMRAAVEAAHAESRRPKILAVTVLTHLDNADLASVGQKAPVADQVLRLAHLAQESGVDGAVCSPHEIEALRAELGKKFLLVVPGIRPVGAVEDDQKRTMTPEEAMQLGADYLVIGRPITGAADPVRAAKDILAAVSAAAA